MTFGKPLSAPERVWVDEIEPYQPPKKVKLSASKASIERALAKQADAKRLQASS